MSPAESQRPGPKRRCLPVGSPVPPGLYAPAASLAARRHSEPAETQGTPGALGPPGPPPAGPGEPIAIATNRVRNRRLRCDAHATSPDPERTGESLKITDKRARLNCPPVRSSASGAGWTLWAPMGSPGVPRLPSCRRSIRQGHTPRPQAPEQGNASRRAAFHSTYPFSNEISAVTALRPPGSGLRPGGMMKVR
jgi:hypothetical protein